MSENVTSFQYLLPLSLFPPLSDLPLSVLEEKILGPSLRFEGGQENEKTRSDEALNRRNSYGEKSMPSFHSWAAVLSHHGNWEDCPDTFVFPYSERDFNLWAKIHLRATNVIFREITYVNKLSKKINVPFSEPCLSRIICKNPNVFADLHCKGFKHCFPTPTEMAASLRVPRKLCSILFFTCYFLHWYTRKLLVLLHTVGRNYWI